MERGAETAGSICLDARELDHLAPLLGFLGDELAELGVTRIDRLNEVGAEDELRVISKQLTRLVFRAQPLPPVLGATCWRAERALISVSARWGTSMTD